MLCEVIFSSLRSQEKDAAAPGARDFGIEIELSDYLYLQMELMKIGNYGKRT